MQRALCEYWLKRCKFMQPRLFAQIIRESLGVNGLITSNSTQVPGDLTSTSTGRAKTPTTLSGPSKTRTPMATRSTSRTGRTRTATRTRRRATTMPSCPRGTSASATPPARTASRGSVIAGNKKMPGRAKNWSPGLVNYVVAVAYHFCLNWPEKLSQHGNGFLGQPCTG